ncbi:DNA repair protein RadC, partial [bacterium]|nr:DNA repair protein RadC [bacterium]
AEALQTEELIAILLRTGMKGMSALEMARQLFREYGHSLDALAATPAKVLAQRKGLGEAKAVQLKAALELARRISHEQRRHQRYIVDTPERAAACLREEFRSADREVFRTLLLDTKHGLLRIGCASVGSLNASIVEPREVFKDAAMYSAASIIVAHNHPSGDPTPSSEDVAVTRRLVKAGETLGIPVLDHIVVGQQTAQRPQDYCSLKELGLMG